MYDVVCLLVYVLCVSKQSASNFKSIKIKKIQKKNQISGFSHYRLLPTKELTPLRLWSLSIQVSKASQFHGSVEELLTNT